MTSFKNSIKAGMIALLMVAVQVSPAASAAGRPDEFIAKLSSDAVASLTGTSVTDEQREKRFRKLLTENFDLRTIGRFVLGLYWRRASPNERAEYLKLFEDFIVHSYAKRFGSYSGESFTTSQVIDISASDKLVVSHISPPNRDPIRIDWRVRMIGGAFKIVDVMVAGISMGVTHRDEFAAVIRQHGGKVSGLIAALREKINK